MLTLEGLIAVIALCLTCFALGYTFGKDSTQKRRQDLVSLATFFVDKILPGHRYRQHPFYVQMITFEFAVVNTLFIIGWSKLIVGWKTLEITLGMFSESDLLLQFYSVFSLLSKSLIK